MKGKLLRGISGSIQPRRLLHGYQDAVFAWSGEFPFANIAQSNLYSISSGTLHNNNWLVKTPYGRGFRAPTYSSSGWIETPSTGVFREIYSGGITIYCKFVLESQPSSSQFPSYFGLFDKSYYYGGIVLGVEYGDASKQRHIFRVGNSATIRFFNNDPAGLNVPVGTLIQAAVTFNPDSQKYTSVYQYKDALHVYSGTGDAGLYMSAGTIIRVGGYARSGNRASQTTSVIEAALWNRTMSPAEMRELLQRPSIFQPTEFIFPFSFGESSGGSEVINTVPDAITLSPAQAAILATEVLNTSAESLSLTPAAASIQTIIEISTAPVDLSIAGLPAAGLETINCTAADLALSGHGAGLVELSVIECSAGAVSVGGELCAVYQAQAISCSAAALTLTAAAAQQLEAGDSVIICSTAALVLAAAAAQQLEAGDSVIGCSTAPLALSAAAAQQVEVGDSVIGCVSAALTLSAAAAQQVEVGDSVIGCVAAALTLTTPSAQQLESGDSVVGCTAAALAVSAPAAQQVEVGDSVISCSAASLTLTTAAAQQVEVGDSVIGCAATIVSLDGTTATITDSMVVRSAAVVLSTPGCSIHDFDIIGAGQAALVTGSSAAALVESGEAIIDTGHADIGIAAAQCGIVQTDAEPIITDIGLVASIDQPTIYATIPLITTTARV